MVPTADPNPAITGNHRGPCHVDLHLPGSTRSIVRCVHTAGINSVEPGADPTRQPGPRAGRQQSKPPERPGEKIEGPSRMIEADQTLALRDGHPPGQGP